MSALEAVSSPVEVTLKLDDDITGVAPVAVGSNLNKSAYFKTPLKIFHWPIYPALALIVPSK